MSTSVVDVIKAAQREATAAVGRTKADAAWLTAWWVLTEDLADLDQEFATDAVAKVADILGQSPNTVRNRRNLGQRMAALGIQDQTLPPRMMLAIPVAMFDAATVAKARKANLDGMSLREFSASLTGKEWSDTAAGTSPEKLAATLGSVPKEVLAAALGQVDSKTLHHVKEKAIDAQVANHQLAVIANGGKPFQPKPVDTGLTDEIAAGLEADQEIEDIIASLVAHLDARGTVGPDTRAAKILKETAMRLLDFVGVGAIEASA